MPTSSPPPALRIPMGTPRESPTKLRLSPAINQEATFGAFPDSDGYVAPSAPAYIASPSARSWIAPVVGLSVVYAAHSLAQERLLAREDGVASVPVLVLLDRAALVVFSLVALAARAASRSKTLRDEVRPASALLYVSAGVCAFVAATCRYQSLRFVSFTSQAVSQAIMIAPVLLLALRDLQRSTYAPAPTSARTPMAIFLAALGGGVYYLSHASALDGKNGLTNVMAGALLLGGYQLCNSMSAPSPRVTFESVHAVGADWIALLWTGVIGAALAAVSSFATWSAATASIGAILSTPSLLAYTIVLVVSAALNPILLATSVAAIGASGTSAIDSGRAIVAIVVNGSVFGNLGAVNAAGWAGVAWLAGAHGVRLSDPDLVTEGLPEVSYPTYPEVADEKDAYAYQDSDAATPLNGSTATFSAIPALYALPLFLPIILGIIIASVSSALPTSLAEAKAVLAQPFSTIAGTTYSDQASDLDASYSESTESESDALADLGIKTDYKWPGPATDDPLHGTDGADDDTETEVEKPDNVVLEGGKWAAELHADVRPTCPDKLDSVTYRNASRRTALATYPRSGNSYIRGLMERSTGYRTSSIYCDHSLLTAYKDECNKQAKFLVKTHFPALGHQKDNHWASFDRAVHLVRNPLDAMYSFLTYHRSKRYMKKGESKHEWHMPPDTVLGEESRAELTNLMHSYKRHFVYWMHAPLPVKMLRYEDLRTTPMPVMMDAIAFIIPDDELPSLERLTCAVELHESIEAYHSPKSQIFSSWKHYSPELRRWLLDELAPEWCKAGYEAMAREHGLDTGVDCTRVPAIVPNASTRAILSLPKAHARRDLQRSAAGSARSPRAIGVPTGTHGA